MHVASIASTICRALKLDADLAWAIGLGHDLGHTPFGHLGEEILSEITSVSGGFSHELYSLRVIDFLANHGKGLNLTYAVRDGIINHCGEQFEQSILPDFEEKDLSSIHQARPLSEHMGRLRCEDVRQIAYLGRDLEDALPLRLVKPEMVPESVVRVLGKNNSEIINTLVLDLIENSGRTGSIGFSDKVFAPLLRSRTSTIGISTAVRFCSPIMGISSVF
jgi:dGTPase